jgi:hypothetical protein
MLAMAAGMFCLFQHRDHDVMLCRNVLKLRKGKKLAQEQEEVSATGALTSHRQRGYWSGQQIDVILAENHAAWSVQQTTPFEWATSPERCHIHLSQSCETVEELPISPPSTPPPLPTLERPQTVPDYSPRIPEPAANHSPQASPATLQQTIPAEMESTSLKSPVSPHSHHRNSPLRNGAGHNEVDPSPGHQQLYEPRYELLPPSSPPIHTRPPSWQHSTVLGEETAAMEENPTHETAPQPPTVTGKRTRSLSPSPMQSKRPRLVSHVTRACHAQSPYARCHTDKGSQFDPELLELGIEVDLSEYDDNPPPYP